MDIPRDPDGIATRILPPFYGFARPLDFICHYAFQFFALGVTKDVIVGIVVIENPAASGQDTRNPARSPRGRYANA